MKDYDDTIETSKICNLSKIPWEISKNPFVELSKLILENNADETCIERLVQSIQPKSMTTKTLASLYDVESEVLKKYPGDTVFLPWIHTSPLPNSYRDVFFDIFHNESYVLKQFLKIKNITQSIKKLGYRPDLYAQENRQKHIVGYWMEFDNDRRFYVTAGNHRVAVIHNVCEEKNIPILYEKIELCKQRDLLNRSGFRRVYTNKDLDSWPSVSSGFLKKSEAEAILLKYIYG